MASTATVTPSAIRWVTPEEGRAQFDAAVRRRMGMSGEEFIRRWEAGEYREIADTPGNLHIIELASLIPFAQQAS